MTISLIPLRLLRLSPLNVRKTKPAAIQALAADIASHGLLQNLLGYEEEEDKVMIFSGGRRYRALKLLHKEKAIAGSYDVPVDLRSIEEALELSLAENVQREDMHPADAILAYRALIEGGQEIDDIAARFGVSRDHVRRLLKLAGLHPKLIVALRKGELSLASAKALALRDDQALQWQAYRKAGDNPRRLRALLTEDKLSCQSAYFAFIGEEDYRSAGGTLTRDLFAAADEAFADNPSLVYQLAETKLEQLVQAECSAGWGTVVASLSRPDNFFELSRLYPDGTRELSEEEQAAFAALTQQLEALDAEGVPYYDERIRDLEARQRELEATRRFHTDEQMREATLYLFIGHHGLERLAVGKPLRAGDEEREERKRPDYPAALLADLGAIRTLAVREALARDHCLALDVLLDCMLDQLLADALSFEQALDLRLATTPVESKAELLEGSSIVPIEELAGDALAKLQGEGRLELLRALDLEAKLELLAFCTASQITSHAIGSDKGIAIDRIGELAGLDLRLKWQPNEAFYRRLTKPVLLKLLETHCGKAAARDCARLRKSALVEVCVTRLGALGVMPPCLSAQADESEAAQA